MKYLILPLLLMSTICLGQTQLDLNLKACNSLSDSEEELKQLIYKLYELHDSDPHFTGNLAKSQELWKAFRDSQLKVKFPHEEPGYYGSVHSMCTCNYLEELTRERIAQLQVWADGIEEGEVCGGSVGKK